MRSTKNNNIFVATHLIANYFIESVKVTVLQ